MLRGEFLESFQAVLGLGHHGTVDSCDECSRAVTRCIRTCLPCAGGGCRECCRLRRRVFLGISECEVSELLSPESSVAQVRHG
eukprot:s1642_g6.t1